MKKKMILIKKSLTSSNRESGNKRRCQVFKRTVRKEFSAHIFRGLLG